jgi:DNA-binding PadR family transcriptional regulator
LTIKHLEKPKGCLETLRLIDEQSQVTVRDLIKKTSLSQSGAYSSLCHLEDLGLIEASAEPIPRGTPKRFRLTEEGKELLLPLSLFFDSLQLLTRKDNVESYLKAPHCSLEILLKTYRRGHVTITSLVKKERMCRSTAYAGLKALMDLGLLKMRVKKGFRKARKEYSLTEKGQLLGKIVFIVDKRMASLLAPD